MAIFSFSSNKKAKIEEIYLLSHKILLSYANEILGNAGLAEDAVQEAFLRLWKNFDRIDSSDKNKTINYMITVVRYICFDMYGRQKNEAVDNDEDISESYDISDSTDFNAEDYVLLKEGINSLSEELRGVFILYYSYGFKQEEISKMLKIPRSSVSYRLIKAKKELKNFLKKGGIEI